MKTIAKALLILGLAASLGACNTVAGLGRDLQALGGNADKNNQKDAPKKEENSGAVVTPVK